MGLAPGKHLTTNTFGHAMQYKLGNCANRLVFDVSKVEWYAVCISTFASISGLFSELKY